MIRVPFLDLKQQFQNLRGEFESAIWPLLENASYIEGPPVEAFEKAFAAFCGVEHAVALDSGTAALHLALLALNIGTGDEVIVPTNTFIATAAAVAVTGAAPVLVDSNQDNWQMDIAQVERKIGPRTKAVIPVHLYGQPVQMDELRRICSAKKIFLIEDAAQAHGARFQGKRIGSLGDAAGFSFYPGKNLGAFGDGGALTTNNGEIAARVRRLRNHGRITKYEHAEVGFNFRMDAIQGAALNVKLRHIDHWNERRRYWAGRYRQLLASLPVSLPQPVPDTEPVFHLFVIGTPERDRLAKVLAEANIETGVHYPIPLHLQPAFRHLGYGPGDFPVAERIARETLSLPIFPEMTEVQFDHVCHSIQQFFVVRAAGA